VRRGGAAALILLGLGAGAADGTAQRPNAGGDISDRPVVLVTGSTDGLGREVARRLAADGAHVIVHGRNRDRGEALVAEIAGDGGSARFLAADLASLDEVRRLAETVSAEYDRLDLLVNNAGIWLRDGERRLSADGHELSFAVNYLSGYLLTRMLLPLLRQSAPARIVNVASAAQTPIDFDDVMLERGYGGGRAYGQSKLAQILFTVDLAEELAGTDITVVALHPATLMDTPMVRGAGVTPRTTVAEGLAAVLHAATAPGVESGQYFNGMRPARAHAQAYDAEARRRLRELTERLTTR
jgi:NAD(P)-dependent dehydrogenase (short-subunit alcohol dehydrogenase family)